MINFTISYKHGFKDYGLFLHSAYIIGKELEKLAKTYEFNSGYYTYNDIDGNPFKLSLWLNDGASEKEVEAFKRAVLRAVEKSGMELHKLKGKVVDYSRDLRGNIKGFGIYVSGVE